MARKIHLELEEACRELLSTAIQKGWVKDSVLAPKPENMSAGDLVNTINKIVKKAKRLPDAYKGTDVIHDTKGRM